MDIIFDFSSLPHKNDRVLWKDSKGFTFNFQYNYTTGEIEIVNVKIKSSHCYLTLKYQNRLREVNYTVLKNGSIKSFICNKPVQERHFKPKYKIGDVIETEKTNYKIVGYSIKVPKNQKQTRRNLYYQAQCLKCGHINSKKHDAIKRTDCVCCTGRTLVPGINDITSTHPWMIPYFQGGIKEAKNYTKGSTKKIVPKCPYCGRIYDKSIIVSQLRLMHGFSCGCSDGISYPEKFIYSLLTQLKINFIRQATTSHVGFDTQHKLYDFYIKDYSCIIETNGTQHYKTIGVDYWRSLEEEQANDMIKKQIADKNGIKHYIFINCYESNITWIKNSIMDSVLPTLFDFSENDIDWKKCAEFATSNFVKRICLDFHNNFPSMKHLQEKYNIASTTLRDYLRKGTELGWCYYDSNISTCSKPIKVMKDGKTIFYSPSIYKIRELFPTYCNTKADINEVYKNLHGEIDTYKCYVFEIITNPEEKKQVLLNQSY